MQLAIRVGKSAAKNHVYPFFRLPETFSWLIGSTVNVSINDEKAGSNSDLGVKLTGALENTLTERLLVVQPTGCATMLRKKGVGKLTIYDDGVPDGVVEYHRATSTGLTFTEADVKAFLDGKKQLTEKSVLWIKAIMRIVQEETGDVISRQTLDRLKERCETQYTGTGRAKCHSYIRAFLTFMSRRDFDRCEQWKNHRDYFEVERVKTKPNTRIVVADDISRVLAEIGCDIHNAAYLLFAAYSGQRVNNIERLTRAQIQTGIDTGVITITAEQEKTGREHYVPVHPAVAPMLKELLAVNAGENPFNYDKVMYAVRDSKTTISSGQKFQLSDCRKFFEQMSDELELDDTIQKFIMMHGMTGIEFLHYKGVRPEVIRRKYMEKWEAVKIIK